jgi:hypothetical protein
MVPLARARYDRCEVELDWSATLPEASGRGANWALRLRGMLMVRRVVLLVITGVTLLAMQGAGRKSS